MLLLNGCFQPSELIGQISIAIVLYEPVKFQPCFMTLGLYEKNELATQLTGNIRASANQIFYFFIIYFVENSSYLHGHAQNFFLILFWPLCENIIVEGMEDDR